MINFDMDGVLAKFLFGTPTANLFRKNYFYKLPPQINIVMAIKELSTKYETGILSAYLEDSNYALEEKKNWLKKWVPEIPENMQRFLPCGESKGEYLISKDDILIDDRWLHGEEWTKAGGKFIKVSVDEKDAEKERKRYEFVIHPGMSPNEIIRIVERRIYA